MQQHQQPDRRDGDEQSGSRNAAVMSLMAGSVLLSGTDSVPEDDGDADSQVIWTCGAILMALGAIYAGQLAFSGAKCCLKRLYGPSHREEDRSRQLTVEKDSGEEVLVKFQRSEGASSNQSSTSVSITSRSGLQQHGESTSLTSRSGLQQHGESTSLTSRSGLQQHGESTSLTSRSGLQQHGESTSLTSRSGLQQHGESTSLTSRSGLQQRDGSTSLSRMVHGETANAERSSMLAGESTSSGSATTSGLAVGEPSSSGSTFAAGSVGGSVDLTSKQGTPRNPWNAFQKQHKGKGLSTKTKASMYNDQKNKVP